MRIGLSLPISYVAGQPAEARALLYRQAFGPAPRFLQRASAQGLGHVELRWVGPDVPAGPARAAAAAVRGAGLSLSVHGALPERIVPPLDETYPALAACLEDAAEPVILVVHALSADEGSMPEYAHRTRTALAALADLVAETDQPLRLALENNRFRNRCDPGATASGIVRMIDGFDPARGGVCWDFGHMFANVRQRVEPPDPEPAFVRRVIHAHVHDVAGRTHQPLTVGNIPLARWTGLLKRAGYDGALNLELNPDNFDDDPLAATEASLRILREAATDTQEAER